MKSLLQNLGVILVIIGAVILIATDGDGVYKLDVRKKELSHFLKEDNESFNKMNGSIIKDIYMDLRRRQDKYNVGRRFFQRL